MGKQKQVYSGLLALALASSAPLSVAANVTAGAEQTYEAEVLAKLQDDVVEYEEISMLVHEYNTLITYQWSVLADQKDDLRVVQTELKSQQGKMESLADDVGKKTGLGQLYSGQAKGFKKASEDYRDIIDNLDKPQYTNQIQNVEDQVVMYAQNAMLGYSTIKANLQTVEKMKAVYDAKYELMVQRASLGMATQTEVMVAQAEALDAAATLSDLQDNLDSTRRTLIVMLGWAADAQPQIQPIPAVNMDQIAQMDLTADTAKAIGNNQTLISLRHETNNGTTKAVDKKWRSVNEGETKLAIEMERLYADVQQKKLDYEAAMTGYEGAKITKNSVETQYQLGMLGKAEYLGAQLGYIEKEAAKEAAELALRQAIETYNWAIRGLAEIES